MGALADHFVNLINRVVRRIGRIACFLVFFIMVITTYEVISRYLFNQPTDFAWPINRQLFGLFILFAGSHTARVEGHIRIEILLDRFPPKMRMLSRYLGLAAAFLFLGTLTWQSTWMGINSLLMNEKMVGSFRMPFYPFKLMIPLASFLFLCQVAALFLRDQFGSGKKKESEAEAEPN